MGKKHKKQKKKSRHYNPTTITPKPSKNPFESRTQKSRHNVLNAKLHGNIIKPTQSRNQAIKKREQTLAVEFSRQGIKNKVFDKRFLGQEEEELTQEDKNLLLFQRQRVNEWLGKPKYRNDNLSLTHEGEALDIAALEKIQSHSDSGSEDEDDFLLEGGSEVSFGGLKKKLRQEYAEGKQLINEPMTERHQSKDLIMKDIIAKSKYYKYQKFQEKEKQQVLTEQLDAEFGKMAQSLLEKKRGKSKKEYSEEDISRLIEKSEKENSEKVEKSELNYISGEEETETDEEIDQSEYNKPKKEKSEKINQSKKENSDEEEIDQSEFNKSKKENSDEEEIDQSEFKKSKKENSDDEEIDQSELNKPKKENSGEIQNPEISEIQIFNRPKKENSKIIKLPKIHENKESNKGLSPKMEIPIFPPRGGDDLEDDFDRMVRELTSEPRAHATDPLKTPEEIARAEKEKLEQLEGERLRRMNADDTRSRRSGDGGGDGDGGGSGGGRSGGGDDLDRSFAPPRHDFTGGADYDSDGDGGDVDGDGDDDDGVDVGGDGDGDVGGDGDGENSDLVRSAIPLDGELPFTFDFPKSVAEFSGLLFRQSVKRQQTIIKRIIACHHYSLRMENRTKMKSLFVFLISHLRKVAFEVVENKLETLDMLNKSIYDLAHQIPLETSTWTRNHIKKLFYQKRVSSSELLIFQIIYHVWPVTDRRHAVVTPTLLFMGKFLRNSEISSLGDIFRGIFISNIFINFIKPAHRFAPEPFGFLVGILDAFLIGFSENPKIRKSENPKIRKPENSENLENSEKKENDDPPVSDDLIAGGAIKIDPSIVKISDFKKLSKMEKIPLVDMFEVLKNSDGKMGEKNSDKKKMSLLFLVLEILRRYLGMFMEETYREETVGTCPLFIRAKRLMYEFMVIKDLPIQIQSSVTSTFSDISTAESKTTKGARTYLRLYAKAPQALPEYTPDVTLAYTPGRQKRKGLDYAQAELKKLKKKVKEEQKGAERELKLDAKFLAKKRWDIQKERVNEKKEKQKKIRLFMEQQQHEAKKLQNTKRKGGVL